MVEAQEYCTLQSQVKKGKSNRYEEKGCCCYYYFYNFHISAQLKLPTLNKNKSNNHKASSVFNTHVSASLCIMEEVRENCNLQSHIEEERVGRATGMK